MRTETLERPHWRTVNYRYFPTTTVAAVQEQQVETESARLAALMSGRFLCKVHGLQRVRDVDGCQVVLDCGCRRRP
jgi:hypothetical protein